MTEKFKKERDTALRDLKESQKQRDAALKQKDAAIEKREFALEDRHGTLEQRNAAMESARQALVEQSRFDLEKTRELEETKQDLEQTNQHLVAKMRDLTEEYAELQVLRGETREAIASMMGTLETSCSMWEEVCVDMKMVEDLQDLAQGLMTEKEALASKSRLELDKTREQEESNQIRRRGGLLLEAFRWHRHSTTF